MPQLKLSLEEWFDLISFWMDRKKIQKIRYKTNTITVFGKLFLRGYCWLFVIWLIYINYICLNYGWLILLSFWFDWLIRCGPAEDRKFAGQDSGSCVLFNPPVPDFSVNRIQVLIFRIFSSHDVWVPRTRIQRAKYQPKTIKFWHL